MKKDGTLDDTIEKKDVGEVRQCISRQLIELERLSKTVSELQQCLSPVLMPEEEVVEKEGLSTPLQTNIGASINDNTKQLNSEIRRLRDLIERIGI